MNNLWCLFYSDSLCLASSEWAAWAQAVGVVVAVTASIVLAKKATKDASAVYWTHQHHENLDRREAFNKAIVTLNQSLVVLVTLSEKRAESDNKLANSGLIEHTLSELNYWLSQFDQIKFLEVSVVQLGALRVARASIQYAIDNGGFIREVYQPAEVIATLKAYIEEFDSFLVEQRLDIGEQRNALPDRMTVPVRRKGRARCMRINRI